MMNTLKKSMQTAVGLGFLTVFASGFWTSSVYAKTDGLSVKTTFFQQQTKKISGVVTDTNGEPLPGVNIVVKGTSVGVVSDFDGNFEINVPSDKTELLFSYIGFKSKTLTVTQARSGIKVVLEEEIQQLEATVVTALGIKRQEKALSYNVQQVKSDELTRVKDANFVNSLNGKVAGVNIQRSSAGVGGATKVIMRGAKSISGTNNALYVVDGIPLNNASSASSGGDNGIVGGGESISDFNPEDIESINILTGPSAAALYGAAAANGVVIINTKKGKEGKMVINVNSKVEMLQPFITPKFQNTYGYDGEMSWGKKLDTPTSYNPIDFFGIGVVHNNSVDFSVGSAQNQTFVSFASTDSEGIIPTNGYYRHNFTGRNTTNFLDNKMHLDISASYILQGNQNMYSQGGWFNPLTSLYLFPRGYNFDELKIWERWNPDRKIHEQYYPFVNNPSNGVVKENPYWNINRELFTDKRKRSMYAASLTYDLLDWLNIAGRVRVDNTQGETEMKAYATSAGALGIGKRGHWRYAVKTISQTYADLMVNINKNIGIYTDKNGAERNLLNVTANIGTSYDDNLEKTIGHRGDLHITPNFFASGNLDPRGGKVQGHSHARNIAVFASTELGWKNRLYLTLTGRTDWASQLVNTQDEAIFYPSAGLSAVVSEYVRMPQWFPFLKLRGSYTEVGSPISKQGFTPGTRTFGFTGTGIDPDRDYPFPNFTAERTKSYEAGLNAKFFNNALSLDVTVYKSNTFNQLLSYSLPESSGYRLLWLQAGNIENKGIEAALSFEKDFGKFGWNSTVTFTRNKNLVKELARNYLNPVTNQYFDITEAEGVREGLSMTALITDKILKRGANGQLVETQDGKAYEIDNTKEYLIGDSSPEFTLGWRNGFKFGKNLSFDMLIYGRFGGVVQSRTQAWLDLYGVSKTTADARDAGGVVIDGVTYDPQKYYSTIAFGGNSLPMYYSYDGTNVRIQEASITYRVPVENLSSTRWLKSLSVSVTGYNLAMLYLSAPFDPESTANTNHFGSTADFFRMPSLRSVGVAIKASL
ncbi:SusC/RagA family TonB-linked outer membrane protein [Capnocytophaga sp.]|uniref:SusC/RagA family TonB-linked outer membrane protein n=1 Tax=Capnocytophaga sp. TaxID=44737 RepID=UPI0026DAE60C|nr:SusC/RagA family TonB-linked outer membrane protein [Capnocytophaga sp.]MDO5105971.1 SusC/RagA family TonB-linked outer membrane protein [Capnocytophaga sp.]